MRLLRLRLAGFGPFRGEQRIDFTRFQEDGLFLIAGRTGAGKSSILDAVAYALYDSAPRYESAAARGVRSDHAAYEDPSFAELEFELGDERYRVRREPEFQRPKRRGEGMTTSPARARLERRRADGEWIAVASGPREVGLELAELLPLQRAQFLQVVLLAQNEFMRFLHADSEERRRVLRALFRTERFERIAGLAAERRRLAAARLERERERLGRLADELAEITARAGGNGQDEEGEAPVSERLERCRRIVDAVAAEAEDALREARENSRRAETEAQRLRSIEERQRRRAEHERRSAELQAREGRIGALRERLAEARRLLPLRPQLIGLERLSEELDRAVRRLRAAVGSLEQPLPGASGTGDPVAALDRAALDRDADEIGRLRPLVEQERTLPELRERQEHARRERERLRGELRTAREDAAALPERRAELL
ncbi:MAG: AAA family ATPase, partial [Pseudoclavibacter sp.]|nr:AAA family ATPase [Pseudoclavibacter sp.]